MQVESKLIKLLETATHPTATDGERLSALNAFRRITDKNGGVEAALRMSTDFAGVQAELAEVQRALATSLVHNSHLRKERDEVLQLLEAMERMQRKAGAPASLSVEQRDSDLIRSALSKDWQELHRIHEKAKRSGFGKPSAVTQECLKALVAAGVAATRAEGIHRDRTESQCWQPRSWRLSSGWRLPF